MTINHDDEYHTDHPKPKDWYWQEPLPPGVKNLDNYKIDFPEHNLDDYVMHSPKSMKHSDTNYEKEIKVDNIFIAADKHDEQMKASESDIRGTQSDQYMFDQTLPSSMMPDWMKDKEEMYDTKPEDWAGVEYPEDPLKNSTMMED